MAQPLSPISLDRYAFVNNDPVNTIDPSGNVSCKLLGDPDDVRACWEAKLLTPQGFNEFIASLPYPYIKQIQDWTISEEGIQFIMDQEGFYPNLYNDGCKPSEECFFSTDGTGTGNCTIGYGHLVHTGPCNGSEREVNFSDGISPEEAYDLLIADIRKTENDFKEAMLAEGITTPVTQAQYDALISLVFNWGVPAFINKDTTKNTEAGKKLGYLAAGDYYGLAQHYFIGPKTGGNVFMPGLLTRRIAEMQMILTVVWPEGW